MEYTISRFMKSALSIGIFILLLITLPYIALFVIKALASIAIFGFLVWGSFKIIKGIKSIIYKLSTKKRPDVKSNVFSSDKQTSESSDIDYNDSVVIDVDYEKVE